MIPPDALPALTDFIDFYNPRLAKTISWWPELFQMPTCKHFERYNGRVTLLPRHPGKSKALDNTYSRMTVGGK